MKVSSAADALAAFMKISKGNPIIFLDYDGTLVNIIINPWEAVADRDLIETLQDLSGRFETFIVTGRSLEDIRMLLPLDMNLIAMHGSVTKLKGKSPSFVPGYNRYRAICNDLFNDLEPTRAKFPGLRIFNKDGGLLFHYGLMSSDLKGKLSTEVAEIAGRVGMVVYSGYNIFELRIPGVSKGKAIKRIRRGDRPAMIAGDEGTDEEAFEMNMDALKIRVGDGPTLADIVLRDPSEMREALKLIARS
ncbi:MAG: trehalose-phosphatase [Candidatus Thermoplasmatota archaeon]|nr:trehalose-phosphatase [Candidatus Thermoplasmatota archaeon]